MKCDLKLSDVQKLSGINIICMPKKKLNQSTQFLDFSRICGIKKKERKKVPQAYFLIGIENMPHIFFSHNFISKPTSLPLMVLGTIQIRSHLNMQMHTFPQNHFCLLVLQLRKGTFM